MYFHFFICIPDGKLCRKLAPFDPYVCQIFSCSRNSFQALARCRTSIRMVSVKHSSASDRGFSVIGIPANCMKYLQHMGYDSYSISASSVQKLCSRL